MPPTKYTYSISADFPGAAANLDCLTMEIEGSAIATALQHIDVAGDVLDIWFVDALSSGDETILDGDVVGPAGGLIAAHDSSPNKPEAAVKEVTAVATSTSNLWTTHSSLTLSKMMGSGTYLVELVAEAGSSATDTCAKIRLLQDTTTVLYGPNFIREKAIADGKAAAGPEYRPVSARVYVTLTTADILVEFQFAACADAKESGARNARWEYRKVEVVS